MATNPGPRTAFLWERLRKLGRRELDRIERDLVVGASEKRRFAGDPNQAPIYRVRTRNK